MSKPRPLLELMTAVDAGLVAAPDVDGANVASRRRRSRSRSRQPAPVVVAVRPVPQTPPAETDASFEFSAAISNSSASPASMVFSAGQLRAHQFPAVRSSAGSSQAASPVLSSSVGGTESALTGSKKHVSFTADGKGKTAAKPAGGQKKGGGLLGCMGSACGLSRDEVVEPTMNANRKVVCA
ncbi:hypothetical protein CFC21_087304 [Triticum aestivum]|uniref:Uncharacterized protein n=2 Tax=Triticum aestivum TaxID=4565 RepID=A0A9R1IH35_WHEAT|nr:hypothetical protein CFC21_087304 [Triticum aestivum]